MPDSWAGASWKRHFDSRQSYTFFNISLATRTTKKERFGSSKGWTRSKYKTIGSNLNHRNFKIDKQQSKRQNKD